MQIKYFASLPYSRVRSEIERLKHSALHLEVEVTDPQWLLQVCEMPAVKKLGDALLRDNLRIKVQGPFLDLSPGSLDPFIRDHSRKLFLRSIEVAWNLNAEHVTLYTGFNPLLHSGVLDQWLEVCLPLWRECAREANRHGVKVLVANMFEDSPDVQWKIIEGLRDIPAGACLDLPQAYAHTRVELKNWVDLLAGKLEKVNLSDSDEKIAGKCLPVGTGKLPIKEFYDYCLKRSVSPDIVFKMTLEEAVQSLNTVKMMGFGQQQLDLF